MDKQFIMEQGETHFLHTYNRFSLVLDKGEGVYLFDTDGKKYLDFGSGIAVVSLGYGNTEYKEALKEQIDKLMHASNYFYNPPMIQAAKRFLRASSMDKVFFTNSGTEAMEGAIKTIKKYAYLKDNHTDHEIIAMEHSFHGRSIGALSVTGNKNYREPFEPMPGIVKFAKFNDLESVASLVNEKTSGIIMETIQGEGGIYPATKEFIKGVKDLCEKHDILFVLDEIQCGMGRTGKMFAWEHYGVKPDIITCAKAIGNGFPVGAFAMTKKVAKSSLMPGDHGTTYGGNPLAGVSVDKVFEIFERDNIVKHVEEMGIYLEESLELLMKDYDFVKERRGIGLMQGLVLTIPIAEVVKKSMEEGLIVLTASTDVLRFLPPLVIEKKHIDEMIMKLKNVLNQY